MKTIRELASLSGISKRTLHHYDDIGLLTPMRDDKNGYRVYAESDIEILQQILIFKEMDFTLLEIQAMLKVSSHDRIKMLKKHRAVLMAKKSRLKKIIGLVESKIKGEDNMSLNEFDMTEIEKAKKAYREEAEKRWSDTDAYKQSTKKTSAYTKADFKKINAESNEIFEGFFNLVGKDPSDERAVKLVEDWKNHITRYYYDCSDKILDGLADMYVLDERFLKNIDKHGKGTAEFMSKAIKNYCEQKMNNR